MDPAAETKLPTIELSREHARLGTDRALRQRHSRGELVRLSSGAYVDAAAWQLLDRDDRYRTFIRASAALMPGLLVSHESAAAMWRLPNLNPWPRRVQARCSPANGGRSTRHVRWHGIGEDPDSVVEDGTTITSLALTLADLAGTPDFAAAIVALDAGLARADGPSRDHVLAAARALGDRRLVGRVARAVDFADARSESPGESLSRVQIRALGLPDPDLQVPVYDDAGLIGVTDFGWPRLGVFGEFDGAVKYGNRRAYQRNVDASEVLVREKRREDRIRRVASGFARWDWEIARDRPALGRLLEAAGVRR